MIAKEKDDHDHDRDGCQMGQLGLSKGGSKGPSAEWNEDGWAGLGCIEPRLPRLGFAGGSGGWGPLGQWATHRAW